jgi:hypothetical protein
MPTCRRASPATGERRPPCDGQEAGGDRRATAFQEAHGS